MILPAGVPVIGHGLTFATSGERHFPVRRLFFTSAKNFDEIFTVTTVLVKRVKRLLCQ